MTMLDLTGQRFVRLQVVGPRKRHDASGRVLWDCICTCGGLALVSSTDLRRGRVISCGCARTAPLTIGEELARNKSGRVFGREKKKPARKTKAAPGPLAMDLQGKIFGSLRVQKFARRDASRKDYWVCLCACGRRRTVRGSVLRSGRAVSCGCAGCKRGGE